MKITISRNKREGKYAGYYPYDPMFDHNKAGHKRWPQWMMDELYPRVYGIYRWWD